MRPVDAAEVWEIATEAVVDFARELERQFRALGGDWSAEADRIGIARREIAEAREQRRALFAAVPESPADPHARGGTVSLRPGHLVEWTHAHAPCGECWRIISEVDAGAVSAKRADELSAKLAAAEDELEALRLEVRGLSSQRTVLQGRVEEACDVLRVKDQMIADNVRALDLAREEIKQLSDGDARVRAITVDRDEWEREARAARERVEFLERRAEGDTRQGADMLEALRAVERERDELREKLHTIGAALGAAVKDPA